MVLLSKTASMHNLQRCIHVKLDMRDKSLSSRRGVLHLAGTSIFTWLRRALSRRQTDRLSVNVLRRCRVSAPRTGFYEKTHHSLTKVGITEPSSSLRKFIKYLTSAQDRGTCSSDIETAGIVVTKPEKTILKIFFSCFFN